MFPINIENVNLDALFDKVAVDISSVDASDITFELNDSDVTKENSQEDSSRSKMPESNATPEDIINKKEYVCITGMHAEYDEQKVNEQTAQTMPSKYEQELMKSQSKLINMLKEFHSVCVMHDIKYWCVHDTFHGILCAKRMLPWSAKIEVGMHLDDYEVLLKNKHDFSSNLFFQTKDTDPYYDMDNIYKAQIRDIYSHYSEFSEKYKIWHNGLSLCIHLYTDVSGTDRIKGTSMTYETSEFSKDVFLPPEKLQFEGYEVYVPNMYNMMCAKLYGEYPPPLFTQLRKKVKEGRLNSSEPHDFMIKKYPELYKNYNA